MSEALQDSPDQHLEALAEAFGREMEKALPGVTGSSSKKYVGNSWNVSVAYVNADNEKVASIQVQLSPDTFRLSWVGVEEKFRGLKLARVLYRKMSEFLTKEKPEYKFSSNAINDITKKLSRQYFGILTEQGHRMRGTVKKSAPSEGQND